MNKFLVQIKNIIKGAYLIPVKKSTFLRKLDGVWRLKRVYKNSYGKQLDEANAQKFSELLFLKMIEDVRHGNKQFTKLADKFRVREFVVDRVGSEYLVPLIWHGSNPEDIPYGKLPSKYIIKTNHGSGRNILVDGTCDHDWIKEILKQWLEENYYWKGFEAQYFHIKPLVIIESFLEDDKADELLDYRFFCFGGEPCIIQVDNNAHDINPFYDLNWGKIDLNYRINFKDVDIPCPPNLDEMLGAARKLSSGIDFVRVDLYNVQGKVYFGEMTFTPVGGRFNFTPESWDNELGQKWLAARDME